MKKNQANKRTTQLITASMAVLTSVSLLSNTVASAQGTYVVKANEGLYRIAVNHGMTMEELKQLNGLTSNLIHPGQVLKVNSTTTTVQPKPVETTVAPTSTTTVVPSPAPIQSIAGTYTVRKGDYLYKIANQYGMTVNQLKQLNGLTSNILRSGQVLKVSGATTSKPAPVVEETTTKPAPKPTTSGTYTVKKGDYLYKIAIQYGMTVDQLKKLNGLTSNILRSGQVLKVSGTTTSKPAPVVEETTTTPAPKPTTSGTYTVKKGDYLYKIATQYGMTVDQLRKLNGLTTNIIRTGQVLKVSGTTTSKPAPVVEETTKKPVEETTTTPAPKPTTSGTYTVKKGDYLYKIASQYGMTVDQLRKLNGLTSNLIYSGQVLKVSGASSTPSPVVQETTTTPAPIATGQFTGTTTKNVHYTVTGGDTLASIAKGFGVSVDSITARNGSSIYVGKSLIIPNAVVKPMDIKQSYDGVKTVWLDAGHGGSETGTYAADRRTTEKTMNLNLDNKLTKLLQDRGYVVRRTRTNDTAVDFVTERSRRANASDADIFISLHHNAMPTPSATGIVSFYYENDEDYKPIINQTYHNNQSRVSNSALLTKHIHQNLINMDHKYYPSNPARDHGVQTGTYAVLRETKLPSSLLEFGFIDTWNDFNKARNAGYQNGIVNAVANGIDSYFNTVFTKK